MFSRRWWLLLLRLTPFDRKLVVVVAAIVLVSFLLPLRQGAGARVLVEADGKTVFVAALQQEQLVELTGPLGTTLLQISDGSAQIISSPCPQKICIGLGKAQNSGDLLACVPNRLVIRIDGETTESGQEYDLISH